MTNASKASKSVLVHAGLPVRRFCRLPGNIIFPRAPVIFMANLANTGSMFIGKIRMYYMQYYVLTFGSKLNMKMESVKE